MIGSYYPFQHKKYEPEPFMSYIPRNTSEYINPNLSYTVLEKKFLEIQDVFYEQVIVLHDLVMQAKNLRTDYQIESIRIAAKLFLLASQEAQEDFMEKIVLHKSFQFFMQGMIHNYMITRISLRLAAKSDEGLDRNNLAKRVIVHCLKYSMQLNHEKKSRSPIAQKFFDMKKKFAKPAES